MGEWERLRDLFILLFHRNVFSCLFCDILGGHKVRTLQVRRLDAILCGTTKLNPGSEHRLIGPTARCFVLTFQYSFGVGKVGKVVESFLKTFLGGACNVILSRGEA